MSTNRSPPSSPQPLPSLPPSLFSTTPKSHPKSTTPSNNLTSNSGVGDNNLCRWLYNVIKSGDPNLQLIVLWFLPIIVGVYLSCVTLRKPLTGSYPSSMTFVWFYSFSRICHPSLKIGLRGTKSDRFNESETELSEKKKKKREGKEK